MNAPLSPSYLNTKKRFLASRGGPKTRPYIFSLSAMMLYMKKLIAVLIIVAVAAAGLYYFRFWKTAKEPYGEKIFPADTIFYASIHSISDASKNLENTRLWKNINSSTGRSKYLKTRERISSMLENFTGVDVTPLLQQFREGVSVGVFPAAAKQFGAAFAGYVRSEKETREFIEQKLDPGLKRRIPDLVKTDVNYAGKKYQKYSSEQLPKHSSPCYVISDNNLVFSYSEAGLRRLLDVTDDNSLRKSDLLKTAKKQIDYERGLLVYVNIPSLIQATESLIPPSFGTYWPSLVKITGLQGLESFSYNIKVKSQGFQEVGYVGVKTRQEGLLKVYMEQPAEKLNSIESVPPENKIVTAGTLPNVAQMWDEINAQLKGILPPEQMTRYQQGLDTLRNMFNFDLRRDLFEPLGTQYNFSYQPNTGAGKDFLKMKFLLAFNLRKPDQFKETVNRVVSLTAIRGIQGERQTYKGKDLNVLRFSTGEPFDPSYYFDGSWFYLASHNDLIKRSIDARTSNSNITSLPDFQEVTKNFPTKLNGLGYTNIQAFFEMYGNAARIGQQTNNGADSVNADYERELKYLAKDMFGSGTYTKIEKNGIHTRSYSSVPTSLLAVVPLLPQLPEILRWYQPSAD